MADLELVRATVAGDQAAIMRLGERMLCIARFLEVRNQRAGRPLDEEELADVVQDSLTVVWKKRAGFEGRARLETRAYRISALEWMNGLRRKSKRDRGHSHEVEHYAEEEPAEDLSGPVEESLERLGPPDAEVIRLKHWQDATFGEIGEALGISPSTAKFWYYRGMDKLRQWLGSPLEEGQP